MRDPFRWSIRLGRWGVPTLRLHVFFLVFAAATYFLCWQNPASEAAGNLIGMVTAALSVLLLSVLAHEWSHWFVARRFGFAPDTLVIGPLGGVSHWPHTSSARGELACLLAGPAVNLLVCTTCAVVLLMAAPQTELTGLLNPLEPTWTERATPLVLQGLQLTIWINWLLFLANLLPAFPFDGGRILYATLHTVRRDWDHQRVSEIVFWTSVILSVMITVVALILLKHQQDQILPTSFALLLLAVILLVGARRGLDYPDDAVQDDERGRMLERQWSDDLAAESWEVRDLVGDDADGHFLAHDPQGMDEPWLSATDSEDGEPGPEQLAEEERQVDRILSRLHTQGMASLTPHEREFLERVSVRYRSRMGRRS